MRLRDERRTELAVAYAGLPPGAKAACDRAAQRLGLDPVEALAFLMAHLEDLLPPATVDEIVAMAREIDASRRN